MAPASPRSTRSRFVAVLAACTCAAFVRVESAPETPPTAPTFDQLNAALGVPLWADANLWDDPAADVAARLKLPLESESPLDQVYRRFPGPDVRWMGIRPSALTVLGNATATTRLALLLSNRPFMITANPPAEGSPHRAVRAYEVLLRDQTRELPAAMRRDETAVRSVLGALLGPPSPGPDIPPGLKGARTHAWQWKGHHLLLTEGPEFLAFRIIPGRDAETAALTEAEIAQFREALRARPAWKPNGDVLIATMPQVPPGPRGFTSTALAESGLRYLGVPADAHYLAMQGVGGWDGVSECIAAGLRPRGLRLARFPQPVRPANLKSTIDAGLPLLWSVWDVPAMEETINHRTTQRANTPDLALWQTTLNGWLKLAKRETIPREAAARLCWIIGYNEATDEIAITDCSGIPERRVQWLTAPEANRLSERNPVAVAF
jgi:hypothetical protein